MLKLNDQCFKKGGWLVSFFGKVFKVLVVFLIIALLVIIIRDLFFLFAHDLPYEKMSYVIGQILFILILLELFTILITYLKTEFIKVERVVEVGIISIIREIIFHVLDIDVSRMYGLSALLVVFGIIFFVEKYYTKERNLNGNKA